MFKTLAGLMFMMMPAVIWCTIIGFLLGYKIVLILLLIIPTIIVCFICKILGKVLLDS